ncbi:putative serpin-Z5 [Panicum virgatum]|uniref:putative serpin-Z5 n=1 Tax=Panicum virgatum TaxID=38727 RepID=UPI0019D59D5A|nr:putative serpin-Z5 [Panicum virgatum]XP_039822614.1 putative serpin-Z5 [Panicum virgatum]
MARKRPRTRRSNSAVLTALSLCLTKHLAPAEGDGSDSNLVFSPASIYATLALLAAGARGGTLQELLDALGGGSRDDLAAFARRVAERALADRSCSSGRGPAVAFACGAWHDAAWAPRPEFRDAAAAAYKAEARAVDFSNEPEKAVNVINGGVAAATNNHIDSILDSSSVNALTNLVVASAIYFKGKWEAPFTKSNTRVDKFHRLDGSFADVPFMRSWRSQLVAVRNGYKVLKLPYKSPAPAPPPYSMCIFLPDERDGLAGLVAKIASGPGFCYYRLPTERVQVGDFRLPKFKLSASGSVMQALRDDMGITSAFVAGEADLSGMAKRDGDEAGTLLHVGDVRHKAVLEVNEEGVAVATSSYMLCGASAVMTDQQKTVDFVADHPFVFFVIEEVSRAILFVGRVLDPSI